ncbi:hypothetical protein JVT61DRAFT_7122 [Boletus reticuloceps]|uniref:Uncharacterized protein n=1 Tax=Boletus reticuloceps TaxID=495285 RepID=A0A8I2YJA4_9AGAM|nr:hypothetical protein JVT61DRAFT_7122 [Boletus reticuloceps]
MKFPPNEPLPCKREIIAGNWALGTHHSTFSSQTSSSLPAGSSTFKSSGTPRSEGTLAYFPSIHDALIEASKYLVVPQLPPYDKKLVEKNYRDALLMKRAAVAHLVDIQARCEDYEGEMSDHIGEEAAELFLTENYLIEDTDTVKGKYYEAVSALTIHGFGISYDHPVSFDYAALL